MLTVEQQQEILDLHAAGRHNNTEIAAVIGTSRETVRCTIKRGYPHTRKAYSKPKAESVRHLCEGVWVICTLPCVACAARLARQKVAGR